jgi:hypothetical protein
MAARLPMKSGPAPALIRKLADSTGQPGDANTRRARFAATATRVWPVQSKCEKNLKQTSNSSAITARHFDRGFHFLIGR